MNPDQLFTITSIIAATGWVVLIFLSPYWAGFDKFVLGVIVILLAIAYCYLNFTNFDPLILKKFSSLEGIANLFQNKALLLCAWVHIMAFDLIGAVWIKRNSVKHGMSHWLVLLPIIFTCVLGPLGFLIYILIRWGVARRYFAENAS